MKHMTLISYVWLVLISLQLSPVYRDVVLLSLGVPQPALVEHMADLPEASA